MYAVGAPIPEVIVRGLYDFSLDPGVFEQYELIPLVAVLIAFIDIILVINMIIFAKKPGRNPRSPT